MSFSAINAEGEKTDATLPIGEVKSVDATAITKQSSKLASVFILDVYLTVMSIVATFTLLNEEATLRKNWFFSLCSR